MYGVFTVDLLYEITLNGFTIESCRNYESLEVHNVIAMWHNSCTILYNHCRSLNKLYQPVKPCLHVVMHRMKKERNISVNEHINIIVLLEA